MRLLGALCVGLLLGMAACLALATVDRRAREAERVETASVAREARLIGSCGGQVYAGNEEDEFPMGCDWVEPIRAN